MNDNDFTPIQRAMLKVLSDGREHTRKELHKCLSDELGPLTNIAVHLTGIRKVLRPRGEDNLCTIIDGESRYSHVRIVSFKGG